MDVTISGRPRASITGWRNIIAAKYIRLTGLAEATSLLIHRPPVLNQLQFKLAAVDQPEVKFDAWRRDPQKFRHFTAFIGFFIY
jgi:hypothetical protein